MRVLLGGKAVVTVRELSILTLDDGPERATVSLFEGKMALGVLRSRMGPREAIEIRTPNAIAAVRGTIFLAEIPPAQAAGDPPNTLISVARGVVGVTRLNVPTAGRVLCGWMCGGAGVTLFDEARYHPDDKGRWNAYSGCLGETKGREAFDECMAAKGYTL